MSTSKPAKKVRWFGNTMGIKMANEPCAHCDKPIKLGSDYWYQRRPPEKRRRYHQDCFIDWLLSNRKEPHEELA